MKIIEPKVEIITPLPKNACSIIELCARTCYKSEAKMTSESSESMMKRLIESKHSSQLEHVGMTVKFICDRGVSHEIVRQRLCSFSQESTRYANYAKDRFGNEITIIRPWFFRDKDRMAIWKYAMSVCEQAYLELVDSGASAQEARSVLPNSLKTEIVVTANLREWLHVFMLRTEKVAHPQMQQVMIPLVNHLAKMPMPFNPFKRNCDQYEQEFDDVVVSEFNWSSVGL